MTLKVNDICKVKQLGAGLYDIIGETGNDFLVKPVGKSRKNAVRVPKTACEPTTPAERLARFKIKQKEHA